MPRQAPSGWGGAVDSRFSSEGKFRVRKVRIDMVGVRHGRLVGLSFVETGRQHAHWRFQCDCGEITIADGAAVRAGRTTSCGCMHSELSAARLTVHGHRAGRRHDPTYRAWQQIKAYCTHPANPRFREFGGRGIGVDPRWVTDFEAFLADLGERPVGTVLGRLDPEDDFRPGNCCWRPRPSEVRELASKMLARANQCQDVSMSGGYAAELGNFVR